MNLLAVMALYPDQRACIAHLERVRWGNRPACPYCGSLDVARKREGKLVGRWNCHDCRDSFNVLAGTVMQKTKIPLVKWFAAIALIVNAKKSLSSCQLALDLELNQGTAWYLMQRIRAAMASEESALGDQGPLLRGIVESDDTYIGSKPRKSNERRKPRKRRKPGRGTTKTPVLGVVERSSESGLGGRVRAMVADDLTGCTILRFIKNSVDPGPESPSLGSVLISDEYPPYRIIGRFMPHRAIDHSEHYSDRSGGHTNHIEGFWGLLKRAWYGQHHHYQRLFKDGLFGSPLYIAEACWKYNHRQSVEPVLGCGCLRFVYDP